MWIAFFNFLSMFFAPLFGSIPTLSTGPALIMVGVFMAEGLGTIDWSPLYMGTRARTPPPAERSFLVGTTMCRRSRPSSLSS